MKQKTKNLIKNVCISMPDIMWNATKKSLRCKRNMDILDLISMERYARYLMNHFDEEVSRLRKNRKCMIIEKGDFSYSYFNVAFLNNMLALICYSLSNGCVPVIRVNNSNPQYNKWDWYFVQPSDVMGIDVTGFDEIQCDVANHPFRATMDIVHNMSSFQFAFWHFLYNKFVVLNESTNRYVQKEMDQLGNPNGLLGVLMRGTDYVKLRPKWHPVQPEPGEVIAKAEKWFASGNFSGVYVATEEERLYKMAEAVLGAKNVMQNKRSYYDHAYYQSETREIGQVHFDRDNDNYWKGIEYLSSMLILSSCKTLVAGNCGGTLFAVLMGDHQAPWVFDYGVY